MQRFKKVGVVIQLYQENTMVLDRAKRMMEELGVTLTFIVPTQAPLSREQQSDVRAKLPLQGQSSIVFLQGKPLVEVVRYVDVHQLDLILIEPEKQTRWHRFFYGSLPLSLVRKAPCPVWIVKTPVKDRYARILVAVDPTNEDREKAALNDKLVQVGVSFAQTQNAECHLLCAWHLPGEDTLSSPFIKTPVQDLQSLKLDEKVKYAKAFEQLQSRHANEANNFQTHLINGEPADVITDFVTAQEVDMVVMGTVARSGVKGFVIGNTCESVLSQIECSVIAIKPDSFKSPLL